MLGNPGDDDDGRRVQGQFLELGVLCHEHQVGLLDQPLTDLAVRHPAQAQCDDVVGVVAGGDEPPLQLDGEVLVQQEPQETSRTAGARWAATWAAYRSAASSWSRLS